MSGPIKIRRLSGAIQEAQRDPAHKPPAQLRRLVPLLLDWFAAHARNLPWRHTLNPYAIWVSEIMLQQTQVKTVIPYWERWMRELPDIESLAKARPDRVLKLWEGLGYYTRARNLQKAAGQICQRHEGRFPECFDEVLALPGIGRYTAGAITSIAFNQPRPIVDGNVIRVLSRLFGIGEDPREKRTNEQLWALAAQLVATAARLNFAFQEPCSSGRESAHSLELGIRADSRRLLRKRTAQGSEIRLISEAETAPASHSALQISGPCSALNQSMMELGATICTPRQPLCETCPLHRHCIARRERRVEELPVTGPRAVSTARRFAAFVIEHRGRFLVCQRPAGVVNARLWEFPNVEVNGQAPNADELAQAALGAQVKDMRPLGTIKHTITRYRITVEAFRGNLPMNLVVADVSPRTVLTKKASADSRRRLRFRGSKREISFEGILTRPTGPVDTRRWLPLAQLDQLAFTSAHRRLLELLTHGAPATARRRKRG